MLKKFLIGTVVALALLVVTQASAADFGTTTLRVGSKGPAVVALQTLVGATADGSFGPLTEAKVRVWQAANGLVADGLFGTKSKAVANGAVVIVTPNNPNATCPAGFTCTANPGTTVVLTGGAGTIDITSSSTDVEDSLKESESDVKVLGFKVEAQDSDIAVTNVKVMFHNKAGATSPEKLSDYIDEVKVFMGSTEVGSADASDFSRTSGDSDVYSRTIALSNAVVRDGDKTAFYIAVSAVGSIDAADMTNAIWTVEGDTVRYSDATGAIMSDDIADSTTFTFADSSTDDKIDIKSSTANPVASTLAVDADVNSDEFLVGAFKLDVDNDSSDIQINELPISMVVGVNTDDNGTGNADTIIASVMVKIDGTEYEANLDTDYDGATGTAIYLVSFDDGEMVIDAGDVAEVKVYATFNDQSGNYITGSTIQATVDISEIDAEGADNEVTVGGSDFAGKVHTLGINAVTAVLFSDPTLVVSTTNDSGADTYKATFVFNVTASDESDIYLPLDDFTFATAGTAGVQYTVDGGSVVKSAVLSSTANDDGSGYLVQAGETEKFTFSVYLTGNDANGKVTLTSIWYEEADGVPSGDPEITSGLDAFKTSSVFLAI